MLPMQNIWIVSEMFFPEETSTAHYLTAIAARLSSKYSVTVVCPNVESRGKHSDVIPGALRAQIRIRRIAPEKRLKSNVARRIWEMLVFTGGASISLAAGAVRGDIVIVGTNPPMLFYPIVLICHLKSLKCFLKIEDVYPENLQALGIISAHNPVMGLWKWIRCQVLNRVCEIWVLGRDMYDLVSSQVSRTDVGVHVITNWSDTQEVRPTDRKKNKIRIDAQLGDKFVLGFFGNLGPLQNLPLLLAAMREFKKHPDVHLLVIGSGKSAQSVRTSIAREGLRNITLLDRLPRERQSEFLGSCDVGLVALIPCMEGLAVPSRAYNLMAAGLPLLAVMSRDSEIARMVNDEQIGWVVDPIDVQQLVDAVVSAKSDPRGTERKGQSARQVSERRYDRDKVLNTYLERITKVAHCSRQASCETVIL